MAEVPKRLEQAVARAPRPLRRVVGLLLILMAVRGAIDEGLGVVQWSGAVWSLTSSLPVWIFLGLSGLFLLTVDLWWPRKLRTPPLQEAPPRTRPLTWGDLKAARVPMDPSDVALREQLEVELVALIEEWHTLRASDFEETNSGAYGVLKEKTSEFIRTVFGDTECQRFESNGDAETRTWNDNVDLRIRALECLRDRSDEWHIRVDAKGLKVAIAARKHLDYGGQLAIGTSPLAKNYEAALSSPNAGAFPGQNPQDDSLAALEKLYTEGDAMLRSAHPFSQITGTAPNSRPTDADIEDWKRRVLAQLPAHYRGRFKVASLRAPGPFAAITAHLSLESEQVRRLRPHVLELEEIIGAMSYP